VVILFVLLMAVALALALPPLVRAALLVLARSHHPAPAGSASTPQRLLFLIPAHNEEGLIAACVRSLLELDYPAERVRVVVIADNCSDATARVTREAGAVALERSDAVHRGKPHAIAWALAQQDLGSVDAVVIIDADSVVEPGFARAIDLAGSLRDGAAQAYFATLNEGDTWLTLLAGLLARVRYEVIYPTLERAGLNSPLTGNGMVIGAGLLEERGWNAFSLTENWELYASLTVAGVPIRYVGGAKLLSQEVQGLSQGVSQRRRWVVGRRQALRQWFLPLIKSRRIRLLQKLDALYELSAAGPVVSATIAVGVAATALLIRMNGLGWIVAGTALSSQLPSVLATATVLSRHPRRLPVFRAMAVLPVYAVWRMGVSVGSWVGAGRLSWQKTQRNANPS